MKSLTLTLATGSGPFNVYAILTDNTIAGVTYPVGVAPYAPLSIGTLAGGGLPPSTPMLRILNDVGNAGNIILGDGTINIGVLNGYPYAPGQEYSLPVGSAALSEISLKGTWIDVADAAQVVHFLWE